MCGEVEAWEDDNVRFGSLWEPAGDLGSVSGLCFSIGIDGAVAGAALTDGFCNIVGGFPVAGAVEAF